MSIMDNVQPAVKKETGKVAAITGLYIWLISWLFSKAGSNKSSQDVFYFCDFL